MYNIIDLNYGKHYTIYLYMILIYYIILYYIILYYIILYCIVLYIYIIQTVYLKYYDILTYPNKLQAVGIRSQNLPMVFGPAGKLSCAKPDVRPISICIF